MEPAENPTPAPAPAPATPTTTVKPLISPTAPGGRAFALKNLMGALAKARAPEIDPLAVNRESRGKDGIIIEGLVTSVVLKDKKKRVDPNAASSEDSASEPGKYSIIRLRLIKPLAESVKFTNTNLAKPTPEGDVYLIAQYRCPKDEVLRKFPQFKMPSLHPNTKWVYVPINVRHPRVSPLKIGEGAEVTLRYWGVLTANGAEVMPGHEASFFVKYSTTFDPTREEDEYDNKFYAPSLESDDGKVIGGEDRDPEELYSVLLRLISRNNRAYPLVVEKEKLSAEELEAIESSATEDHHGASEEDLHGDHAQEGRASGKGTTGPKAPKGATTFAVPPPLNEGADLSDLLLPKDHIRTMAASGVAAVAAAAGAQDQPVPAPPGSGNALAETGASSETPAPPGQGQSVGQAAGQATGARAQAKQEARDLLSKMPREARDFAYAGLVLSTERLSNEQLKVNKKTGIIQWISDATFKDPDATDDEGKDAWSYEKKNPNAKNEPGKILPKCDFNMTLQQVSINGDFGLQYVTASTHMFKQAMDCYGIVNEKLQVKFLRYLIPRTPAVLMPSVNVKGSMRLALSASNNHMSEDNSTHYFTLAMAAFSAFPRLSIGIMRAGFEIDYAQFAKLYEIRTRILGGIIAADNDVKRNVRDASQRPGVLICFDTKQQIDHFALMKDDYHYFLLPNFTKIDKMEQQYQTQVQKVGLAATSEAIANMFYRTPGVAAPSWTIVPKALQLEDEPAESAPAPPKPGQKPPPMKAAPPKPVKYNAQFLLAVIRNDHYEAAVRDMKLLNDEQNQQEYIQKYLGEIVAQQEEAAQKQEQEQQSAPQQDPNTAAVANKGPLDTTATKDAQNQTAPMNIDVHNQQAPVVQETVPTTVVTTPAPAATPAPKGQGKRPPAPASTGAPKQAAAKKQKSAAAPVAAQPGALPDA